MYVLFTGARKNMGDFLIEDRLRRLLTHIRPEHELVVLPRWQALDDEQLRLCSEADLLLLGGGPFYRSDLSSTFACILSQRDVVDTPIAFVAGGWKGQDGEDATVAEYRFDAAVSALLRTTSESIPLSCRDHLTRRVLESHAISNIAMTGCSAWYDIEHLGEPMNIPNRVKAIAFSVPEAPALHAQAIAVVATCQSLFPGVAIHASFNRGIDTDANTTAEMGAHLRTLIARLEQMEVNVHDTSYDLSRLEFHQQCDIHVGYRVHSHLAFCASRKPSYLLNEDGRGVGANQALGTPGLDAYEVERRTSTASLPRRALRAISRGFSQPAAAPDQTTPERLLRLLSEDSDAGFERFVSLSATIDEQYEVMLEWMQSLP